MSRRLRLVYKCDHCGKEEVGNVFCTAAGWYWYRSMPMNWLQFAGTHLCPRCGGAFEDAMRRLREEDDSNGKPEE